ncbi:fungal-specific transcription factor domain-containing protein [Trichoderma sp. SZMC 28012]
MGEDNPQPSAPAAATQGQSNNLKDSDLNAYNNGEFESFAERWPKRPKISVACEECRQRKVKCDGVQPRCGACRRRRRPAPNCVYKPERVKTAYSHEYVAALESRLRMFESAAATTNLSQPVASQVHEDANASPQANSSPLSPPPRYSGEERLQQNETSYTKSHSVALTTPVTPSNTIPMNKKDGGLEFYPSPRYPAEGVDAMGNHGSSEHAYPEGSSSAASFTKQVKDAVASRLSLPGLGVSILSDQKQNELVFPQRLDSLAELCVLPSRSASDDMLNVYWNEIHILYPFVDRASFQECYEKLWSTEDEYVCRPNHILLCSLNAIFALTCQLRRRSVADQSFAANVFFRRSAQLLQMSSFGGGSLELVQACLLLAQYLQSTESSYRCWVVIGLATRIAQSIGLHLPEPAYLRFEKESDRKLSQRLWHGCVFLDRMVSMTQGRPMTISKTDSMAVPLPQSDTSDHVFSPSAPDRAEGPLPDSYASRMNFFSESMKLYSITGDMLAIVYSRDPSSSFAPRSDLSPQARLDKLDFNTVLRIDNSLRHWKETLPLCLQTRPTDSVVANKDDPVLIRQANVLHLRYLQIRILLFRPILALLLTSEAYGLDSANGEYETSLSRDMGIPCAQRCINSAIAMIDLVWAWRKENFPHFPVEPLPAWWFQTFFLYTASIVLIPARRFKALQGTASSTSVNRCWHRALIMIEDLSQFCRSAKLCLTSLQLLNQEIMGETNSYSEPPNLSTWGDPTATTTLFPEVEFDQMPLDYSWVDSLPIDLSIGNDFLAE